MSRFAVLKHLVPLGGGVGAPLTNLVQPTLSGIPREGETGWLGAGEWSSLPNLYRFTLMRDGAPVSGYPVVQAGDALALAWTSADVGHAPDATTVEASAVGGPPWSPPVVVRTDFQFPSDLITPATIPTPTLTRISTAGDINLVYRIEGVDLYDSYMIRQRRFTHAGAFIEENFVPVTESGLTSMTISASTTADPAPYPAPLGTLATDDVLNISLVSADFIQGQTGVVSGVTSGAVPISPSDVIGAMTWSTTDNYSDGSTNSFSPGNMTMTNGGRASVRTNRVVAFDHTYVEMVGTDYLIAVADSSADLAAALTGFWGSSSDGGVATTHAGSYYNNNGGQITYNAAPRGNVGTRGATAVGQIALDRVNKIVWFGVDNTWKNGVPFVSGGLSIPGLSNFYFAAQGNSGQAITLNAGTTPGGTAGFTYTPPSDAVAP